MGMTDAQFKAYLMSLIAELERALKNSPDNVDLQETINRLKEALKL